MKILSLKGFTVAITASRRANELAHIVKNFQGIPYIAPTIGTEANDETITGILNLIDKLLSNEIDYVIFLTGPGAFSLLYIADRQRLLQNVINALNCTNIISRGIKPLTVLKKYGIKNVSVSYESTIEDTFNLLKKHEIKGRTIAIVWHGDQHPTIIEDLYKIGVKKIIEIYPYKYSRKDDLKILKEMGYNSIPTIGNRVVELINQITNGKIDIITFTSPPSVKGLVEIAKEQNILEPLIQALNSNVVVVAVGPSTKKAIEENKIQVDVMPKIYKMGSMIESINEFIINNNKSKKQKIKS